MGNLKPFRLIKNHEDTEMFNTSKRNGENNNRKKTFLSRHYEYDACGGK